MSKLRIHHCSYGRHMVIFSLSINYSLVHFCSCAGGLLLVLSHCINVQHQVSDIYLVSNSKMAKVPFLFLVLINISNHSQPAPCSYKTNCMKSRKHFFCICYLQHGSCHTWVFGWSGLLTERLWIRIFIDSEKIIYEWGKSTVILNLSTTAVGKVFRLFQWTFSL